MAGRSERAGTDDVGTDEVRDLQVRALAAVAGRWTGARRSGSGTAVPEARAVDAFAAGLDALGRALAGGGTGVRPHAPVRLAPAGGDVDTARARQLLDEAGATLGELAEAARRAATTLSAAGAEPAAEYADGLMIAASTLRILVELEQAAIASS